ncbi:MAG: alkylmercury lyase family protein [Acidobacteriia bacterium]|nr:alkylmercury lyase family protein [Terriglobia bacterium]
MAASFVEGRLRNEPVTVTIQTACGHCDQPLRITVNSEMQSTVEEPTAKPLIFEPQVDWATFREPNIVHAY